MDNEELHSFVAELVDRHGLPGMAVGVQHGDVRLLSASGVRNAFTGDAATADTMFQIGSLTKMYTATLVMQLVDSGEMTLDDTLVDLLPELRLAGDPDLSKITLRMLLTHTSGIEGDSFFDTGRGDDAVARLVDRLTETGTVHEPGATWSYCNTGFVLAGRVVEKATGLPWHQALTQRLVRPLGATGPLTLLDDLIRFRLSTGHVGSPGSLRPADLASMPWSQAPAGSRSFGCVEDLLTFACLHLDGGVSADGTRLLSESSVALMQSHVADQPVSMTAGQGIGWFLLDEQPDLVIGHAGDTVGYAALLLLAPERRLAVACLTNAEWGVGANFEAAFSLFAKLEGLQVSAPGARSGGELPALAPFAGSYARQGGSAEVGVEAGGQALLVTLSTRDELRGERTESVRLVPVGGSVFLDADDPAAFPFEFLGDAEQPEFFLSGARVLRRVL